MNKRPNNMNIWIYIALGGAVANSLSLMWTQRHISKLQDRVDTLQNKLLK